MRYVILAVCILLFSCNDKKNRPDVSNIKMDLTIHRFDQDFFSMDTTQLSKALESVYQKHPSFLPLYMEFLSPVNYIVQQGRSYAEATREYLRLMKSLYDTTQSKFKNLGEVEKDLEKNLRYIRYYYPSFNAPPVYASVEGLNPDEPSEIYGASYYHDTLIIHLQMYLGYNYPGYDPTKYFDYIRRRFEPEYIVPNCVRAITSVLYKDTSEDAGLIVQMVEKGKQWFLMDHFLPDAPDSLITLFSGKQVKWCERNEGEIWASIVTNTPDLYTVDKVPISTYLGEAPFTQNMETSNSSPGNLGQWVGWRIVQKFAEDHPEMNPVDVVKIPAAKLFQQAKYKPK